MNTLDYQTADSIVRGFVDASYKQNGTYAYAAGALQSIVVSLLADRKIADVRDTIRTLQDLTKELERK
jgi:hypothetical protein